MAQRVSLAEAVGELVNDGDVVALEGFTCVAPGGAHPAYAHDYDDRHSAFYLEWDAISRDRDVFLDWVRHHVLETADVNEYHASLQVAA
jgi:hypothetical protein